MRNLFLSLLNCRVSFGVSFGAFYGSLFGVLAFRLKPYRATYPGEPEDERLTPEDHYDSYTLDEGSRPTVF